MYLHFFQTLREVFSKPDVKNLKDSEKVEMATAFDTMWAITLALKEASATLPPSYPLEYNVQNFLGSGYITPVIESKLRNVSFEGLTVIAFHLFLFFCRSLNKVLAAAKLRN